MNARISKHGKVRVVKNAERIEIDPLGNLLVYGRSAHPLAVFAYREWTMGFLEETPLPKTKRNP
jgi:hypothetical protein